MPVAGKSQVKIITTLFRFNVYCLSVCCVDFDDHLVANHDQLNPGKNKDNNYYYM